MAAMGDPEYALSSAPEPAQSSHIGHAPGVIRTRDLPLRRNIAQEAKEGQKWL